MADSVEKKLSPLRLRIGVLLIIIWWIPIWLLAPAIATIFNKANDAHFVANVTIVIAIIQTIIGGLGLLILGKAMFNEFRKMPKKKALKNLVHIFLHGEN